MPYSSSNTTITTVHGWGISPDFWSPLCDFMHNTTFHNIDLGYRKNIQSPPSAPQSDYILAHSYGGLWALLNLPEPKKGYIFCNSFYDFSSFTPPAFLDIMIANLQKSPDKQMKAFLSKADCPKHFLTCDQWQIDTLVTGLQSLKNDKATDIALSQRDKSLIILGGQDRICPIDTQKQHWDGFHCVINEQSGHATPHSDPEWCHNTIKSWIDAQA